MVPQYALLSGEKTCDMVPQRIGVHSLHAVLKEVAGSNHTGMPVNNR